MRYFMLFGGWNTRSGGAEDIVGVHVSENEARVAGLTRWRDEESVRLASWMHLAEFSPAAKKPLRVIAHLHIPGAENSATERHVEEGMEDTLHWVEVGPDDPVYSAEG